jgi:hypothetical protein
MDINVVLPYSKPLAFVFLLEILEMSLCLLLLLHEKSCPTARCESAANTACEDADIFNKQVVMLKHISK